MLRREPRGISRLPCIVGRRVRHGIDTAAQLFASVRSGARQAGRPAIIIGCDTLGVTGGPDGQTFILAVTRASEICIGIVCAGFALAVTDFGGARHRLAAQLAALLSDVQAGLARTLEYAYRAARVPEIDPCASSWAVWWRLIPSWIKQSGNRPEIRYRSSVLAQGLEGLFDALIGWQAISNHLVRLPAKLANEQAGAMGRLLPHDLAGVAPCNSASVPLSSGLDRVARQTAHGLEHFYFHACPFAATVARSDGRGAGGDLSRSLAGVALLVAGSRGPLSRSNRARHYVADWLPPLINGGRVFVTICAAEILWIVHRLADRDDLYYLGRGCCGRAIRTEVRPRLYECRELLRRSDHRRGVRSRRQVRGSSAMRVLRVLVRGFSRAISFPLPPWALSAGSRHYSACCR